MKIHVYCQKDSIHCGVWKIVLHITNPLVDKCEYFQYPGNIKQTAVAVVSLISDYMEVVIFPIEVIFAKPSCDIKYESRNGTSEIYIFRNLTPEEQSNFWNNLRFQYLIRKGNFRKHDGDVYLALNLS